MNKGGGLYVYQFTYSCKFKFCGRKFEQNLIASHIKFIIIFKHSCWKIKGISKANNSNLTHIIIIIEIYQVKGEH